MNFRSGRPSVKVNGAGELVGSAAGSLTRPMAVFRDFSVACCTVAECSGSFSQSVSSLLSFVTLFFAGGGASETKTRRAFLVLVSERLHSCSSLSTCREPRYEAPVACLDHRSCPYLPFCFLDGNNKRERSSVLSTIVSSITIACFNMEM